MWPEERRKQRGKKQKNLMANANMLVVKDSAVVRYYIDSRNSTKAGHWVHILKDASNGLFSFLISPHKYHLH